MSRTVVLLVDDAPGALGAIENELLKRYGADYRIVAHSSTEAALNELHELRDVNEAVAVVLADLWMPTVTGIEFLAQVHDLYPTARRRLLIDWDDASVRKPIVEASALGQIDCHLAKPEHSLDEPFHEFLTELLTEWAKENTPGREAVRAIARVNTIPGILYCENVSGEALPVGLTQIL